MAGRDSDASQEERYRTAFFRILGHPAGDVLRTFLLTQEPGASEAEWRRVRTGLRRTDPWLARVIEENATRPARGGEASVAASPRRRNGS